METITFDKLLLKTAFCCMAADGNIDDRELELINKMCKNSKFFVDFDFRKEINILLKKINEEGSVFIINFFEILNNSKLTQIEELTVIDFAIQTIYADDVVEYTEVKFFKALRKCLKISDFDILNAYPDLEMFLQVDINTENKLDKLINNYFNIINLPQFDVIDFDNLKV